MQIDKLCPKGHGGLQHAYIRCHDYEKCECDTVDRCETCGYQHFTTCMNALPSKFGESHDGDTWDVGDRRLLVFDGARGDWFVVPA